ncbi:EF-hand domain-containing protein [Tsuneonella mangrovi]|uniref:EF-hand domain-containing protein n=1 Tax=Tsuneonella mangrovi TaxID=1982042 RepID=UPI000BA2AEB2|nr:EF-hand domain-containing protein [Tsuneonella mangrovi]
MRKLTLTIAAATLATAGLAGIAYAAPGMMPSGDMTRAQATAMADKMFAKMDVNGDGKIDAADREAMKAKMFDRIDTNHDGVISKDEFEAAGPPHRDGDMRGERQGKRGHHRGMRGDRGDMMRMMLRRADTNGDGAITKAEFEAAALKHFDQMDANHDGTVTAAERQAAHDAMKAKWEQMRAEHQAPPPPPEN